MFSLWLWLVNRSITKRCKVCGKRKDKLEMFHDSVYGWYCDEKTFVDAWKANQV